MVSGAFAGFLPWSGVVAGVWSVLDGCDADGEVGDVLWGVTGAVPCATAKPLPRTTINASLLKFFISILRLFKSDFVGLSPSATDTRTKV
jgi:hypothetical protein